MGLITKIFGTYSERELKSIWPIVHQIEGMEAEYKAMTDAQLQAKTPEFKERLAGGLCHCPRGGGPRAGPAPLSGAAGGRHRAASGPHRRDEDR